MVDAIIVLFVIVLIIFAVKGSLKHFKGEGPCCGGSSVKVKEKKLDGPVLAEKDVIIEGMSCNNCKARVENALNSIEGLKAEVDLNSNTAHVRIAHLVSDDEIKKAVSKAGYKVASIR